MRCLGLSSGVLCLKRRSDSSYGPEAALQCSISSLSALISIAPAFLVCSPQECTHPSLTGCCWGCLSLSQSFAQLLEPELGGRPVDLDALHNRWMIIKARQSFRQLVARSWRIRVFEVWTDTLKGGGPQALKGNRFCIASNVHLDRACSCISLRGTDATCIKTSWLPLSHNPFSRSS